MNIQERKGRIQKDLSITFTDCDLIKFDMTSSILQIGYYEKGVYKKPRFFIPNMTEELEDKILDIHLQTKTDPHFKTLEFCRVHYNNITKIWIGKLIYCE